MYRILLVEDEPAARRYLTSIIEQKCASFSVAATAEDGAEALEKLRSCAPDVVLTDIRMAGMDGLDFAARLKREESGLPIVIVSGHQEFEYARRALNTGVVEYLLKPVNPVVLAETLDSLVPRIEDARRNAQSAALSALLNGEAAENPAVSAAVVAEDCWLGMAKFGGPPCRRVIPREERYFAFAGRDESERIYVAFRGESGFDEFLRAAEEDAARAGAAYYTLRVLSRPVIAGELGRESKDLRKELERVVVFGESRTLTVSAPDTASAVLDPVLRGRLDFAAANSKYADIEAALGETVDSWRSLRLPVFRVAAGLREALRFIVERFPPDGRGTAADMEFEIDALCSEAGNWEDFRAGAMDLVRASVPQDGECGCPDAPAFFNSILKHIDAAYAEPLSLASVSAAFRISQTYLCKLFRKHEGRSFSEYLTFRRIEAAKRLMRESPAMPLKDVAQFVGYQDPFYFSRVFKSATGIPPSEYK